MSEPGAPLWMEIDLEAVADNFGLVRRLAGGRRVVAVVKGDAYGHGAVAVARRLARAGAGLFASGSVEEAVALRQSGLTEPILVLGCLRRGTAPEYVRHRLIASIGGAAEADELDQAGRVPPAGQNRPAEAWVKVDGGFGRFGAPLDRAVDFVESLTRRPGLIIRGIYTHLPFSDPEGMAWAKRRIAAFDAMIGKLAARGLRPDWVQSMSSPALIEGFEAEGDVAVGQLLYGIGSACGAARKMPARPALRAVRTRLLHRHEHLLDAEAAPYLRESAGSGRDRPGRPRPLAVVPIGLHHGYHPAPASAAMLIGGRRARVLRVCLETTILDLSEHPQARPGDIATVVGSDGPAAIELAELAGWQSASVQAVMCGLGRSMPRVAA